MAKDTPTCPPLPAGSVDFNKVHDAAKKGDDLNETLDKVATTRVRANAVTKPEAADGPAAPPPAASRTDKSVSDKTA